MIKLGFVSAIVPELGFEAMIDLVAELGYDCVRAFEDSLESRKAALRQSRAYVRQFLP